MKYKVCWADEEKIIDDNALRSHFLCMTLMFLSWNFKFILFLPYSVTNTWSTVNVRLTIGDTNDEKPVWQYPTYPAALSDAYVFAISKSAAPGSKVGKIEVRFIFNLYNINAPFSCFEKKNYRNIKAFKL